MPPSEMAAAGTEGSVPGVAALNEKMRALAEVLDYDGHPPHVGNAIREVLAGKRDDREFVLRLRFQAFVKSMRDFEGILRAHSVFFADNLSSRIDDAVAGQRYGLPGGPPWASAGTPIAGRVVAGGQQ